MARHTTFRFCLDPTAEQQAGLARHAGAARFAFNQCLRLHLQARADQKGDEQVVVAWSGFDLINLFNAWKKTERAGRVITVDGGGDATVGVTGLRWRGEVCQQVFEEAAVDLGQALKAWSDSRRGTDRNALAATPVTVKRAWMTWEPTLRQHPLPEPTTPEKGGATQPHRGCSTRFSPPGGARPEAAETRGPRVPARVGRSWLRPHAEPQAAPR